MGIFACGRSLSGWLGKSCSGEGRGRRAGGTHSEPAQGLTRESFHVGRALCPLFFAWDDSRVSLLLGCSFSLFFFPAPQGGAGFPGQTPGWLSAHARREQSANPRQLREGPSLPDEALLYHGVRLTGLVGP